MSLKKTRFLLILLAIAGLSFVSACDDGAGNENPTDTTTAGDTAEDVSADTPSDVTTTNPDTTVEDTVVIGEPLPITWPTAPADYTANLSSYINTLTIPATDKDDGPACCRDWGNISRDYILNGTNQNDNAFAKLADGLKTFFNLQETLDAQLVDGSFALIWDHQEFNGETTDADNFVLVGLFGAFANATDFTTASAGTGEFTISDTSFKTGTGEPLIFFNPAEMTAGAMAAGPSTFYLNLPLGIVTLSLAVSEALIEATATVGADGVTYSTGTLSGYIAIADVVDAVNLYVSSPTCTCLGLQGPLYTLNSDGTITTACVTGAADLCTAADENICVTLASKEPAGGLPFSVCDYLPTLLTGLTDLDLDGNCATDRDNCDYEGLSVGFGWTAVPATIVPAP